MAGQNQVDGKGIGGQAKCTIHIAKGEMTQAPNPSAATPSTSSLLLEISLARPGKPLHCLNTPFAAPKAPEFFGPYTPLGGGGL